MTTLTNFNAAYFLVDADPTAIPTNVVLLSGNITNWQKLSTNVTITINPSDTYVPYRIDASTFGDSWLSWGTNGMVVETNLYFGLGATNWIARTNNYFQLWNTDPVKYSLWQFYNTGNSLWADVGLTPLGGRLTTSGSQIDLSVSGRTLTFSSSRLAPGTASAVSLGAQQVPWLTVSSRALDIYGYTSTTNFSRLHLTQADTNSPFVMDIQTWGSGTNGANQGFEFQTNSVRAYRIPGISWDDSQVPEAMVRVGATAPTLANFNGGPAQTLQFQNARDDTIMATAQMTHRWKQGTDIHPHVHWCETAATGAGTNIVWQLTYTWTNIGCVYPAYTTASITNSVTGTNWLSQLSEFPPISGTGKLVSSIFVFELKRLANTATADDYNQSVAFLGFDLHHQVDSPGSDSELTKSF